MAANHLHLTPGSGEFLAGRAPSYRDLLTYPRGTVPEIGRVASILGYRARGFGEPRTRGALSPPGGVAFGVRHALPSAWHSVRRAGK